MTQGLLFVQLFTIYHLVTTDPLQKTTD